jgi:predicted enzyme related to lactoylglutathione lyase
VTALIRHITVDCADPYSLSEFWSQVTGYPRHPDSEPGGETALLVAPDGEGPGILFVRVPEGKSGKNRLHLDLQPTDCRRDEQVDKVLGLGATLVSDMRKPDGTGWAVLADPEGNEFCVERSLSERA